MRGAEVKEEYMETLDFLLKFSENLKLLKNDLLNNKKKKLKKIITPNLGKQRQKAEKSLHSYYYVTICFILS